jgi:hypothetical protein
MIGNGGDLAAAHADADAGPRRRARAFHERHVEKIEFLSGSRAGRRGQEKRGQGAFEHASVSLKALEAENTRSH